MQTEFENTAGQDRPRYKRVSRRATVGIVLLIVIFAGGLFFGVTAMLRHSDAYKLGYARLEADPQAMSALGQPLDTGMVMGSISTSNDSGNAKLNFAVTGSKARGTVYLVAEKSMGQWTILREALKLDGDGKLIAIGDQAAGE